MVNWLLLIGFLLYTYVESLLIYYYKSRLSKQVASKWANFV